MSNTPTDDKELREELKNIVTRKGKSHMIPELLELELDNLVEYIRKDRIATALSEMNSLEANSDCLEDGCGLDAGLLVSNLSRRITELQNQIKGEK